MKLATMLEGCQEAFSTENCAPKAVLGFETDRKKVRQPSQRGKGVDTGSELKATSSLGLSKLRSKQYKR